MIDSIWHRRARNKHPVNADAMRVSIDNLNPRAFTGADLREWPPAYLHYASRDKSGLTDFNRAVVAAEIERRKAWDAPAAVSAMIATLALVVALAGFVVTIARAPAVAPQQSRYMPGTEVTR